jgi:hypothetical protein
MVCGSTCVNATLSTASLLAFYSFDSVTTDTTGHYPLNGINSPIYGPGWVGSAISFDAANPDRLNTSNIPLSRSSFTIDFWFYALNVSSGWDIAFMGQCLTSAQDQCLFLSIYAVRLCFGQFNDDYQGTRMLAPNTWYHAAYTNDNSTQLRTIYLNGILDRQGVGVGPLQSTAAPFTVGGTTIGGRVGTITSYYTGYIDQLTITGRVKSACELYLIANLACYFTLDSASPPVDSGANILTAVNSGSALVAGRVNQALQFASPMTYITISDISALKSIYSVFTISMWIKPTSVTGGTLIHGSSQSNGQYICRVNPFTLLCNIHVLFDF